MIMMLSLTIAYGGVIYAPTPTRIKEEEVNVWKSSTLNIEAVDFTLPMSGEYHGQAVHLYGVWDDPQSTPSAYILLGGGERADVKSVTLYVKGVGKYRVQVFIQREGRLRMAQTTFEASDSWKPVTVNVQKAVEVIGGLVDRPNVRHPFKVVILPYANKDTGEKSQTFDLNVSPVFINR